MKIYYKNLFEELELKSKESVLHRFGMWLAKELDLKEGSKINVTKIWVTEETDKKLRDLEYKFYKKKNKTDYARRLVSWAFFQSGPAVDMGKDKDTSDDYILLLDDWEITSDQRHEI